MSFRFIEDHCETYPVRLMCAVLEVSPAGYYAWRERPVSERTKSNATLLAAIRQVHRDSSGRYGSPRVHADLRTQGRDTSRGRVERMMRRHGIRAIMGPPRRVRTTDSRHDLPIAPNLITRDFTAGAPNRVWLADYHLHPDHRGVLYLAAVMDLFSRKIVGWAMRDHMQVELASAALTMAIHQQRPQAPPLRSRRAVCLTRLSRCSYRRWHHRIDEPQGRLLRKRPDGELLPYLEDRARPSPQLQHPRRSPARHLRLHRGLLQPNRLHSSIGYIAPIEMELKAA
jgi:putative transposase